MSASESISFSWILDRRRDLIFYVGSALVGWLYAGLTLPAVHRLDDPLSDALAVFSFGGFEIQLTLTILVVASWAILLDAPHIWATLARTMLDPDEWRTRGNVLARSWGWFCWVRECFSCRTSYRPVSAGPEPSSQRATIQGGGTT